MAFPFKTILVPIDLDDMSNAALEIAVKLARQNQAKMLLLYVVTLPPTAEPTLVDVFRGQEEEARKNLDKIAREQLQGIEHKVLTEVGAPAKAIVRAAQRMEADLIVMATHGRKGLSRMLLGSVTEMVLRETPCPVLCVRQEQ